MECVTAANSRSNAPTVMRSPSATSVVGGASRCSLSFASRNASVSVEPMIGRSSRRRSRYGTAPMWSSWPWVSTTASTWSMRSSM